LLLSMGDLKELADRLEVHARRMLDESWMDADTLAAVAQALSAIDAIRSPDAPSRPARPKYFEAVPEPKELPPPCEHCDGYGWIFTAVEGRATRNGEKCPDCKGTGDAPAGGGS